MVLILSALFLFLSFLVSRPWPKHGHSKLKYRFLPVIAFFILAAIIGALFSHARSAGLSPLDSLLSILTQWQTQISLGSLYDWVKTYLDLILQALIDGTNKINQLIPSAFLFVFALSNIFIGLYMLIRFSLVFLMMLVSWVSRLIHWLQKLLGRPVKQKSQEFKLHKSSSFLAPSIFSALVFIAFILAFLPYWAKTPSLDNLGVDDYFSIIFWVGCWLLTLELYSLLKTQSADSSGTLKVSSEDAEANTQLALQKLFNDYQKRFKKFLLRSEHLTGNKSDSSNSKAQDNSNFESIRKQFQGVFSKPVVSRMMSAYEDYYSENDLLFVESLHQAHLLLFCELLIDTLNNKGSVLVICPEGSVDETDVAFADFFRQHYVKLPYQVYKEDDIRNPDIESDFFIFTVKGLERLLSGLLPHNLSLMLVLGIESLDLTLLRHELARLWLQVESKQVRKVFQVQAFYNAEPTVKAITEQSQLKEHSIIPCLKNERFILLWGEESATQGLRQHYLPNHRGYASAAAMLTYLPNEQKYGFLPVWIDSNHCVDKDLFERLLKLPGKKIQCDIIRGFQISSLESPVLILEDKHNVLFSLSQSQATGFKVILVNIVSSNYLLRNLMLKQSNITTERFLPVLPRAIGNLQDLARQVARCLYTSDGLAQNELDNLLRKFSDQSLLTDKKISPSVRGLKNLLATAFDITNVFIECKMPGDKQLYKLNVNVLIQQIFTFVDDGGNKLGSCNINDYGLIYSEYMTVLLHEKHYYVKSIDRQKMQISVVHIDDEAQLSHRYIFDREYTLITKHHCYNRITRNEHREGVAIKIDTHIVDFKRKSFGAYQLVEFDVSKKKVLYKKHEATITRKRCNALKISFSGSIVDSLADKAKVSFTLAALLQDVLYSLFPYQHKHIAVLSVQPQDIVNGNDSQDKIANMAGFIYPRLNKNSEIAVDQELAVYLVEDSDGDLGVINTIAKKYDRYLSLVQEYLLSVQAGESVWRYHYFGGAEISDCFDYKGVREMLTPLYDHSKDSRGYLSDNQIHAPEETLSEVNESCDFCGKSIAGQYDELGDGRKRCPVCSVDAIDGDDINAVRLQVIKIINLMESRYEIDLPKDLHVQVVSADTIAQRLGDIFLPTQEMDPRAVGLAVSTNDELEILIENGAPKAKFILTVAHELTHIWQYRNTKTDEKLNDLELVEGQATYIMLDYGNSHDLADESAYEKKMLKQIDNEYSRGLKRITDSCGDKPASAVFECFDEMLS